MVSIASSNDARVLLVSEVEKSVKFLPGYTRCVELGISLQEKIHPWWMFTSFFLHVSPVVLSSHASDIRIVIHSMPEELAFAGSNIGPCHVSNYNSPMSKSHVPLVGGGAIEIESFVDSGKRVIGLGIATGRHVRDQPIYNTIFLIII